MAEEWTVILNFQWIVVLRPVHVSLISRTHSSEKKIKLDLIQHCYLIYSLIYLQEELTTILSAFNHNMPSQTMQGLTDHVPHTQMKNST